MVKKSILALVCVAVVVVLTVRCCVLSVAGRAAAEAGADPALVSELQERVETLCAAPRYGATLLRARDYIRHELETAGWSVRLQEFENKEGVFYNVVAERPGRQGAGRYIIGAHYDACDSLPDAVNPGADDNASGVAVLLAVAKRLPAQPESTLELVFYACEEPPWFGTEEMGSAHHAASCRPEEVRGMVCLEMLGCFRHDGQPARSYFPGSRLLLPAEENYVAVIGDWGSFSLARQAHAALRRRLPALRLNLPCAHDTPLWFSDHRNYEPLGIPSIMITDTAMLRNDHYHLASDTPDSLCYPCMGRVAEAVVELICRLAYAPSS